MRLAASRCRFSPVVAVVLATLLAAFTSSVFLMTATVARASAAAAPLSVKVDRSLSLIDEAVTLTIGGKVSGSLTGTKLVVRVKGPAELSQIGQAAPELPEADKIVITLGEGNSSTSTTVTDIGTGTATATTAATTTTTTKAPKTGRAAAREAGLLEAEVAIPAGMPAEAGAYLLVVEVKSGSAVLASGQVWVGKAAPRDTPLDLAFVWPISLGIHRDPDGVFYDQVLEEAVAPAAGRSGDLRGLLELSGRFSDWDFTLAVEPVFVTQLRDMADGYSRSDASGNTVDVSQDDVGAKNAGEVLAAFKGLESDESVEVAAGPYSSADLGVLAAQGWRDGFEQIQLGKQELQQALDLGTPPTGGYSPDLDLTTASLAYYAEASIDHVVVDAGLAKLFTEPIGEGIVAVRARNAQNDRVTLLFANSGLSAHMTAPWDTGMFFAALAAELASGSKEAFVLTPRVEFGLVPEAYLESIGETLQSVEWIETRTLTAFLREHAPDTRPILLKADSSGSSGYIEESLLIGLRAAHAVVTDLAAVADATRAPVEASRRLLYMAESQWWSRMETSPQEASIGLEYAERAQVLAQGELDKIRLLGVDSTLVVGGEGVVSLSVQNDADYPVTVGLRLAGTGLTLPEGEQREVELPPGRTEVPVRVTSAKGPHQLDVVLVAGQSSLDEASQSLRFITVMSVLPWAIIAALVIGGGISVLVLRHRRRRAA